MLKQFRKISIYSILILSTLLVSTIAQSLISYAQVPLVKHFNADSESWYSSDSSNGWSFRKSHLITQSEGSSTGYQIQLKIHSDIGTDSGADVYLNGNCRPNFGDIRFTSFDSKTPLSYWIESVDDNIATVWVKIADDLSMSNQTIFLYYGNPAASSLSNGESTFLFFDDFGTGTLDKWTAVVGSWTVVSGTPNYVKQTAVTPFIVPFLAAKDFTFSSNMMATTIVRASQNTTPAILSGIVFNYQNSNNLYYANLYRTTDNPAQGAMLGKEISGSYTNSFDASTWSANTWYSIKVGYVMNAAYSWINGMSINRTDAEFTNGQVGIEGAISNTAWEVNFAQFFVRKWQLDEPKNDIWGLQESWGNLDWQFRKSHTIESASGAGSNYTIQIRVHSNAGTDSQGDVYLNNRCRPDFGDIRFTDSDGTLLNYWIQSISRGIATIWLKVNNDLSLTDQTIYLYYGNSAATTTSDGDDTFLFFDDFSSGTLDKWNVVTGTWTVVSGTTDFVKQTGTVPGVNGFLAAKDFTFGSNMMATAMIRASQNTTSAIITGIIFNYQDDNNFYQLNMYKTADNPSQGMMLGKKSSGTWTNSFAGWSWSTNTWNTISIGYLSGAEYGKSNSIGVNRTDSEFISGQVGFEGTVTTLGWENDFSAFFIRPWQLSEPRNGVWGQAESWYVGGFP
jgi:hypothetical protein